MRGRYYGHFLLMNADVNHAVEVRTSQWLPFSMRGPNEKIYLGGVIIFENCNNLLDLHLKQFKILKYVNFSKTNDLLHTAPPFENNFLWAQIWTISLDSLFLIFPLLWQKYVHKIWKGFKTQKSLGCSWVLKAGFEITVSHLKQHLKLYKKWDYPSGLWYCNCKVSRDTMGLYICAASSTPVQGRMWHLGTKFKHC